MKKALSSNAEGFCFFQPVVSFSVIRLGFEPRAHTLKVYCSTS